MAYSHVHSRSWAYMGSEPTSVIRILPSVSFAAKHAKTCMSLAVKHNGVFVTWLITKYDWSRKACLRTSSVMPPLPSLYYEYSPILLPPNRGASLLFIRSRRSRLESPRSMRNSALSTYSSVLSSKAQTSGFSCLNNSTICLSNASQR